MRVCAEQARYGTEGRANCRRLIDYDILCNSLDNIPNNDGFLHLPLTSPPGSVNVPIAATETSLSNRCYLLCGLVNDWDGCIAGCETCKDN